jgi:hypothetical protein
MISDGRSFVKKAGKRGASPLLRIGLLIEPEAQSDGENSSTSLCASSSIYSFASAQTGMHREAAVSATRVCIFYLGGLFGKVGLLRVEVV